MNKLYMSFFAIFCWSVVLSGGEVVLPLNPPPAPFIKKTDKITPAIFSPKVEGDAIVSGNKQLKIRDNGGLELFLGGRHPVILQVCFKTNYGWWSPDGRTNIEKGNYNYRFIYFVFIVVAALRVHEIQIVT